MVIELPMMNISFIDPLSRAMRRTKKALFSPFSLKKWFVVGFTAFLADLMGGYNGNFPAGIRERRYSDLGRFVRFPQTAWVWLIHHPFWFGLIIVSLLAILVLFIILTWLSSRGKFMFLDNVIHDNAMIVKPWHDLRLQGDSLFLWRIAFGFIILGIFALFAIAGYVLLINAYWHTASLQVSVLFIIVWVLLFILVIITILYVSLFLNDFVVPLMYKNGIRTNEAWRQFLSLFSHHWPYFILYGLFKLLLMIAVVIGVVAACFLTCCIGFIFLIIPYISSVVTLPISYAFRAYSVEFLAQFGPQCAAFPQMEDPAPDRQ